MLYFGSKGTTKDNIDFWNATDFDFSKSLMKFCISFFLFLF
jgi:hypothetical protein